MSSLISEQVTPLVLAFNEEPNIARALDSLRWAKQVFVLDSGSTDRTIEIAHSFANVKLFSRPFDTHLAQYSHGIYRLGISTKYILVVDADMQAPANLVREIEESFLPGDFAGGLLSFEYRYFGHALKGSLYPPQINIFKTDKVRVTQTGHAHNFAVDGKVYKFRARLIHDDRKSIERWVSSQLAYQVLNEKAALEGGNRLRYRLRRLGLMPPIAGALAYLSAGGPFGGAAALRYAYERAVCEGLLAIRIINTSLSKDSGQSRTSQFSASQSLTDRAHE